MIAAEQHLADLMRAALAGDSAAYRRFLHAAAPRLRAAAIRQLLRCGAATADAEDIVQETLLVIHTKRQTWDPGRPIGPWLTAIARHKLIDHLRRRGASANVSLDDIAETLPSDAAVPDGNRIDIETMLHRLSGRQRSVVRALSLEGASVRDTAAQLGMTEGAVRVTLHRSLNLLSAMFRGSTS